MAVKEDLKIDQGTDWVYGWAVTVDLEGDGTFIPIPDDWTVEAQIRKQPKAAGDPLHVFEAEISDGNVLLSVDHEVSSAWSFVAGVYDVEVTGPGGFPRLRVREGGVVVSPEVTR